MLTSRHLLLVACALAMVSGCARYRPLSLDPSTRYAPAISDLHGGDKASAKLSEADVTALVLQNNPSLRLAAARRSEIVAQGHGDALLPNPSFTGSVGYLLSGAGNATAWTAGLSQGLGGFITLRARRDEAVASVREIDASLAWETWQVVGKARLLVTDIVLGEALRDVQAERSRLLDRQWDAARQASARGDLDATVVSPLALAANDARVAHEQTERDLASKRRELTALMGLSEHVPLILDALPPLAPFDIEAMHGMVEQMPMHRPDLIALAMGYDAQDARVRAAILAQFPPLAIGYDASQDNSRVRNGGPAVSFDLPVFDRGTARVAAAEATRQRLHDEYAARVADAVDEAHALATAYRLAANQLAQATSDATDTPRGESEARGAFQRGDIDRGTYTDLGLASLDRQASLIQWTLLVREQRVALDILLGIGMPAIHHEAS